MTQSFYPGTSFDTSSFLCCHRLFYRTNEHGISIQCTYGSQRGIDEIGSCPVPDNYGQRRGRVCAERKREKKADVDTTHMSVEVVVVVVEKRREGRCRNTQTRVQLRDTGTITPSE